MNLHKEIQEIKLKRDQFLKSFAPGEVAANDIVNASKDIYLPIFGFTCFVILSIILKNRFVNK